MEEIKEAHSETGGPFLLHGDPITDQFIESCKTARGGFTFLTVKLLTGERKPTKGWKRRVLGETVDDDVIEQIIKDIIRRDKRLLKRKEAHLENIQNRKAKKRNSSQSQKRKAPLFQNILVM